jgi:hypothetical protein
MKTELTRTTAGVRQSQARQQRFMTGDAVLEQWLSFVEPQDQQ